MCLPRPPCSSDLPGAAGVVLQRFERRGGRTEVETCLRRLGQLQTLTGRAPCASRPGQAPAADASIPCKSAPLVGGRSAAGWWPGFRLDAQAGPSSSTPSDAAKRRSKLSTGRAPVLAARARIN